MNERRAANDPFRLGTTALAALIGGVGALLLLSYLEVHLAFWVGLVLAVGVAVLSVLVTLGIPAGRPSSQIRATAAGGPGPRPETRPFSWADEQPSRARTVEVRPFPLPVTDREFVPAQSPAPLAEPPVQPITVDLPVRGGTWWNSGATAPSPVRRDATSPASAGKESSAGAAVLTHAGARRVVQCPECGDFAVDVHQQPLRFTFTCRRCRHGWAWEPGTPWPRTMIRPRRGPNHQPVNYGSGRA